MVIRTVFAGSTVPLTSTTRRPRAKTRRHFYGENIDFQTLRLMSNIPIPLAVQTSACRKKQEGSGQYFHYSITLLTALIVESHEHNYLSEARKTYVLSWVRNRIQFQRAKDRTVHSYFVKICIKQNRVCQHLCLYIKQDPITKCKKSKTSSRASLKNDKTESNLKELQMQM